MLPPGTRTVSEREKSSYAAHLMGSVVPFKFLIPPLACALNRMEAPRDKRWAAAVKRVGLHGAEMSRRADPSSNLRRPRRCMHPRR